MTWPAAVALFYTAARPVVGLLPPRGPREEGHQCSTTSTSANASGWWIKRSQHRRIVNIPVPKVFTDLHRALLGEVGIQGLRRDWLRDLSDYGHRTTQIGYTAE